MSDKEGTCCICSTFGPLTYEHVPPRSAFNDQRIFEADVQAAMDRGLAPSFDRKQGRYNQKGAGRYSLCDRCNTTTGKWYAGEYVEIAKLLYPLSFQLEVGSRANVGVEIRPLRLMKQFAAMFCSACGPAFAEKNPQVTRFILNRDLRDLPDNVRFWIGLMNRRDSNFVRQAGITGKITTARYAANTSTYAEICFPPFVSVMLLSGSVPDHRLYEITWFKDYDYYEKKTIVLGLYSLPVYTYFPADYRSRAEVEKQLAQDGL
jgi:hypothetical protein